MYLLGTSIQVISQPSNVGRCNGFQEALGANICKSIRSKEGKRQQTREMKIRWMVNVALGAAVLDNKLPRRKHLGSSQKNWTTFYRRSQAAYLHVSDVGTITLYSRILQSGGRCRAEPSQMVIS